MNEIAAIAATGPAPLDAAASPVLQAARGPETVRPADFSTLVSQGIQSMDAKIAHADQMVGQFALDDSIPVHQVTIALEEARLSVEFAMQVRQRFVEGYRDLMNMQL